MKKLPGRKQLTFLDKLKAVKLSKEIVNIAQNAYKTPQAMGFFEAVINPLVNPLDKATRQVLFDLLDISADAHAKTGEQYYLITPLLDKQISGKKDALTAQAFVKQFTEKILTHLNSLDQVSRDQVLGLTLRRIALELPHNILIEAVEDLSPKEAVKNEERYTSRYMYG